MVPYLIVLIGSVPVALIIGMLVTFLLATLFPPQATEFPKEYPDTFAGHELTKSHQALRAMVLNSIPVRSQKVTGAFMFTTGLIEGVVVLYLADLVFRSFGMQPTPIAVALILLEFVVFYADGIFRRNIGAEIPTASGFFLGAIASLLIL